ncbi:hypothetical protein AB0K43_20965 [Kitasatospora sp. NPDC049258]|uniref:DUF7848 domain-containing protein n=1 Tax=Kitasatospora sp. NPDC049258 TaxID=3155394 RepID=UPI00341E8944
MNEHALHGFRCLEPDAAGTPCGAGSGLAEGEEHARRWLAAHQAEHPLHQAFVHICHRGGGRPTAATAAAPGQSP